MRTDTQTFGLKKWGPGPPERKNMHFQVGNEKLTKRPMPMDGKFLFHSIGYHLGLGQMQVREKISQEAMKHWGKLAP